MSLLGKLKSLFGGSDDESESSRDVSVTVERERADSEAADEKMTVRETAQPDRPSTADEESAAEDDSTDDTEESPDTDQAADDTPSAERDESTDTSEGGTPVDKIKGIGPTYADRLSDAGIETVDQLAEADAESLAAETDISETRLQNWIDQAKVR